MNEREQQLYREETRRLTSVRYNDASRQCAGCKKRRSVGQFGAEVPTHCKQCVLRKVHLGKKP